MTECNHDWRIDPTRTLTSNPPRSVLVCADCGTTKPGPWGKTVSLDPKDWEKFEE